MLVDKKKLQLKNFTKKDYPSFVVNKISSPNYKKPITKNEKKVFWKSIEKLLKQYSFRLGNQYNVDQEELLQQSYIFVNDLLDKYQPAFPCDYIYSNICNSKCPFWNKCLKQDYFGWNVFEIKPYLFFNVYQKMRDYCQRDFKRQKGLFDLDFSGEVGNIEDACDAVLVGLSNKKSMTSEIERKIITEIATGVLDDVLNSITGLRKDIGIFFYKENKTEKQIRELVGKSQSTVNIHLSAIRKSITEHHKISSLIKSGITLSDLLDDNEY